MRLSGRMKSILLLLSKEDAIASLFGRTGITRNHIVYAIEAKQWETMTHQGASDTPLLLDKVRVSYDRTFKRLIALGLVEGGFPKDLPRLSPYQGTLWQGYCYTLTDKGRREAEEVVAKILRPLTTYSNMLTNAVEQERPWA